MYTVLVKYSMSQPASSMSPDYAELHCLSNFSFLRGAAHPEELVARAQKLGYSALALTDECSFAGLVRAHVAARASDLKLIIGTEIRVADGLRLVLLVDSAAAYAEVSSLITHARRQCPKGQYYLTRGDLETRLEHALALWLPGRPATDEEDVAWCARHFPGRCWLILECLYTGVDKALQARLQGLSVRHNISIVAAGDVHMHVRSRRALLDVITSIRLGTTVAEAGHALFANSERHLRSRARLAKIYPAAALAETLRIAQRCSFSLSELSYRYPRELVSNGSSPRDHLRKLTRRGMVRRWPNGVPVKVQRLIEHELELIAALAYEAFFLTVYDLVQFARSRDILCQGRGSAANSAVCFALGITEVDPARMEMLFERFISRERNEPPDIDVDFEHERREEVIQYIYEKYGRARAALAATVVTYRARSAIRDVGKSLGMSLGQVDRLAKNMFWFDGKKSITERLGELGFDPHNDVIQKMTSLVSELIGFPRHLSQHVGGFVISDSPLHELVPIENAAMVGRTVIQWDKDDLEALGLLKVDCLSLGMLTAMHRACDLIGAHRGIPFSLADIPPEDPATYKMIQQADTVGVFQIESRAQMAMLPRLRPASYYDLVIEVAIIRPGPIQGEMVHPYLRRRNGEEKVEYPSDEVRDVLKRTLGVPLFQEQVIKLAMVAAGFSPGEADMLRRSMASWRRNGNLEDFRGKLVAGMRARGYEEAFAERIFNQIQGFGEYGFPESHAASFALLAYFSAWLKCHEPAAFTAALLNSQPMGFYAPAQLIQDAQRHGVEIRAVDVFASDWDCTLEHIEATTKAPALRLGLRMVKGLRRETVERLIAHREKVDEISLENLHNSAGISRRDFKILAQAGALKGLAGNRHQAYWAALGAEQGTSLLPEMVFQEATPMLRTPREGENICADYVNLGLTLERHPVALLRAHLRDLRCLSAAEVQQIAHGITIDTAGLVIARQRPSSAAGVVFMTLEDETGNVNLIVWSSLAATQRREVLSASLLKVTGTVQRDGDVVHVIVRRLQNHSHLLGRLPTKSRDFH